MMAGVYANGTSHTSKPTLDIPSSMTTVAVKIIDVSTISNVPADALFTPAIPGFKIFPPAPSFSFLIEHPSGQKVLFDLGIRKDWNNLAPEILARFKKIGHQPSVEKNVSEVLDEAGIGKENINAVIWSHSHWDHTGDMSTFGPKTDLVVGPGFKEFFLGGGGNSSLGGIQPSDIGGRNLREIAFDDHSGIRIGQNSAYDYFNDGSLYLLDTPGHCVAHLCALARTTTNPDTFVYLGGDAAHHCGEFRPSPHMPMPESISPHPSTVKDRHNVPFCPGSWFEDLQKSRNRDPKGPLWQPSFGHDMDQVLSTIRSMWEYDGSSNIFVILAHDQTLRDPKVPTFPQSINDWHTRGLGEEFRWTWLRDIVAVVKPIT